MILLKGNSLMIHILNISHSGSPFAVNGCLFCFPLEVMAVFPIILFNPLSSLADISTRARSFLIHKLSPLTREVISEEW